jgi:hypothetical protein
MASSARTGDGFIMEARERANRKPYGGLRAPKKLFFCYEPTISEQFLLQSVQGMLLFLKFERYDL